MFAPLPLAMTKLASAVHLMDDVVVQSPPQFMEIGERLRLAYARSRVNNYLELGQSELRELPFAYWLNNKVDLVQAEPELTKRYWSEYLPKAVDTSPRRAKRWLHPLFFTYCENYDSENPQFQDFSKKFLQIINISKGLFAEKLRETQKNYDFFSPTLVAVQLAKYFFLTHEKSVKLQMSELLLWPGFVASRLGREVFKAGLNLPLINLKNELSILKLMDWNNNQLAPVVKTDLRIVFANAMLRDWVQVKPSDSIKNILIGFFLKDYGDPRFKGHRQYQWEGVDSEAIATFLNWLTGDTLRGFMKLLQRTADDIWMYRQKFWMAYYEKGYIDEAWLALGNDAFRQAEQLQSDQKGMGYGRLESGATNNQSVMFLKIGDIIFTEWSHNGSLRANHENEARTPKLYQEKYQGAELRSVVSMDFHHGMNAHTSLVHSNSSGGTWQRKARFFISRHTGVFLNDWDIL